jgi:hypothetical protein
VIAVVKYGFMVDHYVAVLAVTERMVEVGDPMEGRQLLSHKEFMDKWRRTGIVVGVSKHP